MNDSRVKCGLIVLLCVEDGGTENCLFYAISETRLYSLQLIPHFVQITNGQSLMSQSSIYSSSLLTNQLFIILIPVPVVG